MLQIILKKNKNSNSVRNVFSLWKTGNTFTKLIFINIILNIIENHFYFIDRHSAMM